MLADDEDAVDGQVIAAAAQGFGDGRIQAEAELAGAVGTLVTGRALVDVHGDNMDVRIMPHPLVRVTDQEAVDEMLGVREVGIDGGDDGDAGDAHDQLFQKVDVDGAG